MLYSSRRIRSSFPRSSTTFYFETPGGSVRPGCPCYEKWPGCARVNWMTVQRSWVCFFEVAPSYVESLVIPRSPLTPVYFIFHGLYFPRYFRIDCQWNFEMKLNTLKSKMLYLLCFLKLDVFVNFFSLFYDFFILIYLNLRIVKFITTRVRKHIAWIWLKFSAS